MALGLTIIFGVTRVFNFSHGGMAIMGGYFSLLFLTGLGMGMIPAILCSLIIMFFFGLLLFRSMISTLLRKPNWDFASIIFLLGLGILLENMMMQLFGPRVKAVPKFFAGSLKIGFLRLNWHEASLILFVISFVIALNFFLKKTWLGKAMRAVAQDMTGARVVGININRTFSLAFALATTVTGFAGILLGTKYYLTPHIGWDWMFKGFIIVVFGGLGSALGAIYAAFFLGITEAFITLYLSDLWVWPIWFIMFVGILVVRPQGLAGGRTI
jgi:branched-chain amino acid transport system permease protein